VGTRRAQRHTALVVLEEMSHAMEASVAQPSVDVLGFDDGMGSGDEGADLQRARRQQVEESTEGCVARSSARSPPGSRSPAARTGRRSAQDRRSARNGRRAPSRSRRSTAGRGGSCRCPRPAHDPARAGPQARLGRCCPRRQPGRCDRHRCRRSSYRAPARDMRSPRRRARTGHRPGCLCHAAAVGHSVDPNDADTGGNEQPYHQLSDQPEADDARRLAELHLGPAHALHGDGSDRRERGVLRHDTGGNGHAQVGRDPVQLRVEGELVAGRRHDVPDGELLGTRTDLDDDAAQGIAERGVAVQLAHGLAVGRDGTLLDGGVENLPDLVGPGPGLPEEGETRLAHLHQLGAGRDERVGRPDEHSPGFAGRRGHVEHDELTRPVVLGHLPHATSPSAFCPLHRPALLASPPRHRQRGRSGTRARG
jgi:hypothetical protein